MTIIMKDIEFAKCKKAYCFRYSHLLIILIIDVLIIFVTSTASAESPKVVLTRLTDTIFIAEDYFYAKENSIVYIGKSYVTVVGATWTQQTASLLSGEITKITSKPIKEVINTNHDLDRVGGNSYFKSIGARIVSIKLTHDLLIKEGKLSVKLAQKGFAQQGLDYPNVTIVLPDTVYEGDFSLQDGNIRGFYLGPSHKPDDIFIYFPKEKVLYGGCVLKEQLGNMEGADIVEYPKTLQKLKRLDLQITTIVAGHFSPLHGPELIDEYLKLLSTKR